MQSSTDLTQLFEHPPAGDDALAQRVARLFEDNVHGVFVMRLDEPFHWPASSAEQDDRLDYAFEHLRITAANDVVCAQLGGAREQVLGTPPSTRWRGDPARWREHMRRLYAQGSTHHSLRAPRRDGSWYDVEGEYVCTYDAAGRITGHCGIQHDITRKLLALTDAAHGRDRLELAVGGLGIAVWDIDLAKRQVYYDARWMNQLGYGDSDVWRPFDWWASVVHPDDRTPVRRAIDDHVEGREPVFRAEHRLRTASGSWVWLVSTGRVARDQPHRVVGISVDITDQKLLHERVVAAERLAALGTLAAGVGHEINNPLTYVMLNLGLLQRSLAAGQHDALPQLVERARFGAERVGAIVRDLQLFARPPRDAGGAVEPVPVIERCLELAAHQIVGRARVVCELAPTPAVPCTEDRLIQVVLNLLLNAAQAIPEGNAERNAIRVATTAAGDQVQIEISDTGAGIAPVDLGRVFEPFFTTKRAGEGTGLGLSICRSIVTGAGGQIEVASEPGRGTTFRVVLPTVSSRARDSLRKRPINNTEPPEGGS